MKRLFAVLIICFFSITIAWCQVGSIRGTVLDKESKQPLIGVNVIIEGTQQGDATDIEGSFFIQNVPVGTFTLRFSFIGYEKKLIPDIVVKSNKASYVNAQLSFEIIQGEEITVTTGYFEKPDDAPVSLQTLSYEEVRRSPGSREDVSRMIQNVAGVNPTSDDRNDLVVRGGSPTEVLYMIDDIEIPNPNHFGTQGATGGPISMVNVEFVENIDFMAGGFTANYGHKSSGVVDILFREGNRLGYNGKLDFNFGGAGGYCEGPLRNNRGSFLVGIHRSFLDFLEGVLDYGGVPVYSNLQGKLVYDLNTNHQWSLLWIGGDDRIKIDYDLDVNDFETGKVDSVDYYDVDFRSRQITVGSSLRSLWSKNFYTRLILSHSYNYFDIDNDATEISGFHNNSNNLQQKKEIRTADSFDNTSTEQISSIKLNGNWFLGKSNTLSFGTYTNFYQFDHNIKFQPFYQGQFDMYGQIIKGGFTRIKQNMTPEIGIFANYKQRFWHRFVYNIGARYDYFKLLNSKSFSPRFNLLYNATHRLTLQTGIGRYYQRPEFLNITAHPSNKENLTNFSCDHYIIGMNYLVTPSTRLTVEVYHKKYSDYPALADSGYEMISLANRGADYGGSSYIERLTSAGAGKANGLELMVQKKLVDNFYGLASYSYSIIKHKALDGVFRNGAFDNRHVCNLVMGYRLNKSWEFSFKWRYAGGAPYTPYDREASIRAGRGNLDLNSINEKRFDPYHRLDLRLDRREFHKKTTVIYYLSLENIYNRKNILSQYWNQSQQKTGYYYQSGLSFIGGMSIEF